MLELPVCYSISSAEHFARSSVALLDKLGVVDTLCFGSEEEPARFTVYGTIVLFQKRSALQYSIPRMLFGLVSTLI